MGAELIGGIDPCEIDRDPKGQLDGIFALTEKYRVGVDIHLHEDGDFGLVNVFEICTRASDPDLMILYNVVTHAGAKALGIESYGFEPGAFANFVTMKAGGAPEAVASHPPRKLVFFKGQMVAEDGEVLASPQQHADAA